jgi:hypothetical protein
MSNEYDVIIIGAGYNATREILKDRKKFKRG